MKKKAKDFYYKNNIYYYSLADALCEQNICKIISKGKPLYHDTDRLTLSGAKYIGHYLIKYIHNNIPTTK